MVAYGWKIADVVLAVAFENLFHFLKSSLIRSNKNLMDLPSRLGREHLQMDDKSNISKKTAVLDEVVRELILQNMEAFELTVDSPSLNKSARNISRNL